MMPKAWQRNPKARPHALEPSEPPSVGTWLDPSPQPCCDNLATAADAFMWQLSDRSSNEG